MTAADGHAGRESNPMFDRMTDGEIAAYFEDRDREPSDEPSGEYLDAEAERQAQRHREQAHGGAECDCPEGEPQASGEPWWGSYDDDPPY